MKKAIIALSLALASGSTFANTITSTSTRGTASDVMSAQTDASLSDGIKTLKDGALDAESVMSQPDGSLSLQDIEMKESFAALNGPAGDGSSVAVLTSGIHIGQSHADAVSNARTKTFSEAAEQDPTLHYIDFSSAQGLNTPFNVPADATDGESVNFFSGAEGSAQVVDASLECPLDCDGARTVLMGTGDVQISFSSDVHAANLIYRTGGSVEKLTDEPPSSLTAVLFDANGKLIGSRVFSDLGTDSKWLDVASDVPFRSMTLTTDSDEWFISDLAIAISVRNPH